MRTIRETIKEFSSKKDDISLAVLLVYVTKCFGEEINKADPFRATFLTYKILGFELEDAEYDTVVSLAGEIKSGDSKEDWKNLIDAWKKAEDIEMKSEAFEEFENANNNLKN